MDEQIFRWTVISLSAASLEVAQNNLKINTATFHATLERIEQEKQLLKAVNTLLERINNNGELL